MINYTYRRMPFRDAYPLIEPLVRAHVLETQDIHARIDTAMYERLDDAGMFLLMVAFADGVAVGYASHTLYTDMHRTDRLIASQDGIYVDPAHRGRCSVELLEVSDKLLHDLGAHVVVRHARHNTMTERRGRWVNPAEVLYRRAGYQPDELAYTRILRPLDNP